jgi:hypothetical protein
MLPPATNWVRFLRNYGPLPTNGNLFDEHVNTALMQAGVAPIVLPTPHVDEMLLYVQQVDGGSLLIAGTAGDGKTYHARQLWLRLGGSDKVWGIRDKIKSLELPGNRRAVFIKDLSELKGAEGDGILDGLEASVSGASTETVYVIACNHGQILDRLRKHKDSAGNSSKLLDAVHQAFLRAGFEHPRLKVVDLSRSVHRQSLGAVIKAVTEHPEWKGCAECPLNANTRVCPIAENRKRAIGADDSGRFVKRLGDLIEIARMNGEHLPVRDLLALAANMLLGNGHPDVKEGLMTCTDVASLQDADAIDLGSIYRNVFAANLTTRRAMARPVFRTLRSLGIGEETTNGADGLLVYGSDDMRLREDFERYVGIDQVYGATKQFLALQHAYLEGDESARIDDGASPFLARLADQRQRLFFTLPDEIYAKYPFWELTAFRFAGDYLRLVDSVAPSEARRVVDERIRARLVQGLNRVMTGLLLDNPDTIFVANSGGFTQSKISVLCETSVPSRRQGGVGMQLRWDRDEQRPAVEVALGGAMGVVPFHLTPVRFEFLCRVAEGALPSSFSNECFEDLLAFKARLLRKAELARMRARVADVDDEVAEESTGLGLTFIEIEQNGHGFLKRITVRAPQ